MIYDKTVGVVVPAYNEESQIKMVLDSMPEFVDRIIVVNDCSSDKTEQVVSEYINQIQRSKFKISKKKQNISPNMYNYADVLAKELEEKEEALYVPCEWINYQSDSQRIILISHKVRGGVGAGIATGYKWCKDYGIDCVAVMAGDGQMDPDELEDICLPIIQNEADYVKGNRLIHKSAKYVIPKARFIGNSVLSMLTKIASGYWHISDTQTGYTAISLKALEKIDIYDIYKSYGMPNDLLVKLNIVYCSVKEIPIKPVYKVGEKSKMKITKVIPRVTLLLIKSFFKRIWTKYFLRDFHPIFLFYMFSFFFGIIDIGFFLYIFNEVIIRKGTVSVGFYISLLLLSITSIQFLSFAMWIDIQENDRLYK